MYFESVTLTSFGSVIASGGKKNLSTAALNE
jgi:hypothetical protein